MLTFHRLLFLFCVTSIFALGLAMIFGTSSAEVLDHSLTRSTHQAMLRQMLYAILGIGLGCGVWYVGYEKIIAWSPFLLALFCFFLVLVLIPGIGKEVNGSKRWLSIAGISFQPSEFVKYLVPAYFINRILKQEGHKMTFLHFCKLIGLLCVPIVLIIVEPNNGTAGVICVTLVMMCILTRIAFKYWAIPLLVILAVGALSAYNLPYVSARLKVYLNPELDIKGKGHQPYQAKIAAGSGQLFGRGPGNSLQKLSYLPEAQNDYIAAIFAEEFGFIGMITLISLYMLVGYVGFYFALQTDDRAGFYFATAITFLICFQAFMNLGVVSGLLPSTGLNLPLFSQGGSSLMINIIGLVILLNISQKSEGYLKPI